MLDSLASFFTINLKKKEKKERHNSYNHTNNHSIINPFSNLNISRLLVIFKHQRVMPRVS